VAAGRALDLAKQVVVVRPIGGGLDLAALALDEVGQQHLQRELGLLPCLEPLRLRVAAERDLGADLAGRLARLALRHASALGAAERHAASAGAAGKLNGPAVENLAA